MRRLIPYDSAMQFDGDPDKGEAVTCPGFVEDIAAAILIIEDSCPFFRHDMGTGTENIVFDPVLARAEIITEDLVTIRDIFLSFPGLRGYLLCVFQRV